MRVTAATEPGSNRKPNEDHLEVGSNVAIVIDGATARTDTGCIHGVSWYAAQLGSAIQHRLYAAAHLKEALASAIKDVTGLHDTTCDLSHPGTPSAAIAILRQVSSTFEWLVLGDVTIVLDTTSDLNVISDSHSHVAKNEQEEADRYPIGDPRKTEAMVRMKHAELAARNVEGGFWVVSTDPTVAKHAITGSVQADVLTRAVLLTDGAARLVDLFRQSEWKELVSVVSEHGPGELLKRVRKIEVLDPEGRQWPRNKRSDDATAVLCEFH